MNHPPHQDPAVIAPFHVLLVDDHPLIGKIIGDALRLEDGIVFHYCDNAADALARAEGCSPSVILQDLAMPDHIGLELLQQYRNSTLLENVPVIVLSGTDEPQIKKESFLAGANDYMVKSQDTVELVARIRYHARSYLHLQQRDAAYAALRESELRLHASNAELERLTYTDGLTGIANRRHFNNFLDTEWLRAQREKTSLGLLLIDIDFFKPYNDNYGHVGGDAVLRQVGASIAASAQRPADLAARYGGEEFGVILPGTDLTGALLLAEKIRAAIEALAIPHQFSTAATCVTISIGAAVLQPSADKLVVDLIKLADAGLYRAKDEGRNRVVASP